MVQPIIYFATDHAGFELKQALLPFVRDILGYEVVDCGATSLNPEDDFTDFISQAAREVAANPDGAKAIILGGSGQGEAMLANRFHSVRAVVYYGGNKDIITLSRTHNDANILSLGARFVTLEEAKKATMLWLHTAHVRIEKYDRRIKQTDDISATGKNIVHAHEESLVSVQTDEYLKKSLAPSLPASSFAELQHLCESLAGLANEIQIDIVDGEFAPFTSWPFTESDVRSELLKLKQFSDNFALELDCMCLSPETYLDLFVEIGVARVIIHAESTDHYETCIAHAHAHGYKIGLGVLNSTNPKLLDMYANSFDFVQIMGIAHIGQQGQPFDETTISTVKNVREKYPHLEIAIDGAVNETTIPRLLEAGANRFAPGSAIAKARDIVEAYKQLARVIGL